jgi:hypothetical protein
MSFIDWIFGKKSLPAQPDIRFGHYTDAYKTKSQLDAWEQSRQAFEREDFMESYRQLFHYIKDEKENNVSWSENEDGLYFELVQGSQKIKGRANKDGFQAESALVKASALNIGLLRRVLDQNAKLTYSSYALTPDNEVVIKFTSNALDGSPYKIYYGLKEMATNADKQDDLLIYDFDTVQIIDESLRLLIPEKEKEWKYEYVQREIKKAIALLENVKLNLQQQPKAAGYALLDAIFRLEYLVCPAGFTMEVFEQAQRLYFLNDGKNQQQKNVQLLRDLEKVGEQTKESFFKEMYRTKSTFGITQSVSNEVFVQYFDQEAPNIDWYSKAGHEAIALAVCNNIAGFCLFNYTLPKPLREFLHLYFEIMEEDFFKNLDFDLHFNDADGILNKKEIKMYLDNIVAENAEIFPKLNPTQSHLVFDHKLAFAKSFLQILRNADFSKAL